LLPTGTVPWYLDFLAKIVEFCAQKPTTCHTELFFNQVLGPQKTVPIILHQCCGSGFRIQCLFDPWIRIRDEQSTPKFWGRQCFCIYYWRLYFCVFCQRKYFSVRQ
jgi:hypothetical protein